MAMLPKTHTMLAITVDEATISAAAPPQTPATASARIAATRVERALSVSIGGMFAGLQPE
jgi:hypothetical protein